ncbi:hypothetical protein DFH09DRAFT_489505 [Mycena vulgaris]|nr:hypothetical protein DFH09DRAFT_489505 [Mycena vulgaris]
MSVDAIVTHLKAFQTHADTSGNTRAHGSPGYTASADYVFGIASDAGLDVHCQGIVSPFGIVRAATLSVDGVTFAAPNVTAGYYTNTTVPEGLISELVAIPGYGCAQDEFVSTANKNVLLKAGQCEVSDKSFNALVSFANAIII